MAEGVELAAAWVRLVPSFEGVTQNITQAFAPGAKAAEAAGDKAGRGWSKRAKAAIGTAAIGAGLVASFKGLYDVGETFTDLTNTIRTGTGAQGDALNGLVDVAKNVGKQVPASFDSISPVVADLNTRLGLTGGTLETVASQYLEAGRILGEEVDIAQTTAAFSAFKVEGDAVSGAMDSLFQVSQATGVGMNELAAGAQTAAPALANLGFGFEDSIALIGSLDKAGLNSTQMLASMSKGLVTLAKDGEQPQEAFARVTSELQGFVDTGDTAAALDLASQVFGTRGASQFVGALQSGVLSMDDLMAATGATADTILGVGEETMTFSDRWQQTLNTAMVAIEPLATALFTAIGDGMEAALPVLQDLGAWASENTGVLAAIAGVIAGTLVAAMVAWTASIWAQTAALLASPITWIILAIVALIAAVVALVMNWDTVVAWITEVWAGFVSWITGVLEGFAEWWSGIWDGIVSFVTGVWQGILDFFAGVWEGIKGFFSAALDWLLDLFLNWTIYGLIIKNWDEIVAFFTDTWENIKGFFGAALEWIDDLWTSVWTGVSGFFTGLWDGIVRWFEDKIAFWQTAFRIGLAVLKDTWERVWNGIKSFFSGIWDGIKRVFQTMIDFVTTKPGEAFEAARDAIGDAWAGIQELAKKPVRFVVNTVINGLIDTINMIPGVDLPKVRLPKGFAEGGIIPGYDAVKRDTVWTPMRKGEGVLVPEVVRGLGADMIHALNAAGNTGGVSAVRAQFSAGLARGGLVNPLPRGSYSVSQPYHGGHNGIDLAAATGTKVYAAADGIVGLAGSVPMGGNEVYVQHSNGLGTRYSHLSRFATQAGSLVKAGNVIGYVGSTGMSTGPHLHYMVHSPGGGAGVYGNHVNPAPYMGLFGKDLGEGGGLLGGLVDWVAGQVKEAFPAGGMWIDVAAGIAKDAAKRAIDVFTPKLGTDTGATLYDNGGWLPPGFSLVENRTGRPEPILTGSQWDDIGRLADQSAGRGDGPAVFHLYDADGVLMGTIDGRIEEAASGGSERALHDVLGTRR